MKRVLRERESLLVIMIVVLIIIITSTNSVFLRSDNLVDILRNASVLGILACGMLLVILTGGIDVSVGAVTAANTCICGMLLKNVTDNIPLVFVICMVCGMLMGLGNGLLISRLRIPPIVVTLGTYNIVNGLMLYATKGTWITGLPDSFTIGFGQASFFNTYVESADRVVGLPIQVIFFIASIIVTWWLLRYTRFGRSVYALGGNREAAIRSGYNVKRSETLIFVYMGLLAGFAAVVHVSIFRQIDPSSFLGYEINVIAATVIGGVSINGGYGSILGAILGVFFMTILQNGLILMRIPTFWQKIVTGLVIIIVVSVDMYTEFLRNKNRLKVDVEDVAARQ